MNSMKQNLWWLGACAALFILPAATQAEESGIDTWGVNDATYGLKTREAEFSQTNYTASPADWRDINLYQLFTDRFADSGTDQLGGYKPTWKVEGKNFPYNRNYHHGGDWKGLQNNLDYLTGMGVRGLWISGVQQNDQGKDTNYTPYHQYHPDNFFKCDPAMGTFAELKSLIDACHARGIYVILDVAPNHMCDKNGLWGNSQNDDKQYWSGGNGTFGWWNDSNKHPAPFDTLSYFHNNGTINCWDCSPENLLGQFKGTDDLKTEDAAVQSILAKAFKNLIDATDCDGFRVDAIKHVEYNWVRSWAQSIRDHAAYRGKKDFIVFGELFSYNNAALASYCADGYGFNSALFFPMSQTIKGVFGDGNWTGRLGETMNQVSQYGVGASRLVTFIDNHDLNRIALQISGTDTGNAAWKLKPALSFLYLAAPVPCLFYGTEHVFNQGGHYNGSSPAADNPDDGDWQRECMFDKGFQPGPAQGNKLAATDAPLYQHIKALNAARAAYKSLTRGSYTERWQVGGAGPYAFSRVYDTEESLVALNTSDGSVSINPQVGKADGTQFVNVLNPTEKVTVSGGRLTFSLSGKETKVFVAGIAAPELWVKGTHNSPADGTATAVDPIFVNTEAGPTGVVASAKVGYSADGGTSWNVLTMTATNWSSQGGTWYYARLGSYPAGTVIKYYIEVADTNNNKKWDNNGGPNFSLTVKAAAGVWVRSTKSYPLDGDVTDATDLYLNTEAGPSGQVTAVTASVSTNAGASWLQTNLALKADWGSDGGNWYEVNLGKFPAGTTVRYAVTATGATSTNVDNNNGAYYQVTVRASESNALWVGDTGFNPANGEITAADPIQITTETWPLNGATNVALVFTTDGGTTWNLTNYTHVGSAGVNDIWQVVMGPYADGTTLRFAAVGQAPGQTVWDNNGGQDYRATVGEVGGLRMVEHTPTINTAGGPDNLTDSFDFDTTGGAASTGGTTGFGSFGSIYVNFDETNLYVGGTGVDLPHDSDYNAYVVFLSGGTNAGNGNLWSFNGLPNGIDQLHNVLFNPGASVAILLGDVWGDGAFTNFNMYKDDGFDFGQGVFATPAGGTAFAPMAGAQLSQFGGYGYSNRLAAHWECAIPLARFGATNASQLTNLYLSGLIVNGSTTNNNRYLSGKYLGDSATITNAMPGSGNFEFELVSLGGTKVLPPQSASEDLGVPDAWVAANFPSGYVFTASSDYNSDGQPDRHAYFAGLDPKTNLPLDILTFGGGRLGLRKSGGQSCTYVIDIADEVQNGGWNWTPYATVSSLNGMIDVPDLGQSNVMMRVRVNVPAVDQPVDRVTVGATPPGGTFSSSNLNVTLSVSGVNVISATYSLGASPLSYTNGEVILIEGMTNGQTRTLTLAGSTLNGVSTNKTYTFTKTAANVPVSWTGSVGTEPASGAWDTNESLTVSFQTAPIGAAVAANIVYNTGSGWTNRAMTKGAPNASNDTWALNLGSYPAGTTVQFALEAKDSQGNSTWENNGSQDYRMTVNGGGGGGTGKFTPYATNPTKGQYRSAGITIDGANTGSEWTTNLLVALDMANDDPRTLGGNWVMHEAPIDLTHLWACWDDNNLYLAWQAVDVTDKLDGNNAGSSVSGKTSNNQGHLLCVALDTQTGGSTTDMWGKSNLWTGANTPDFMLYMNGNYYSSYMSTALPGNTWAGDAQLGSTYNTFTGWGITKGKGDIFAGSTLWGVGDTDQRNNVDAPTRNFLAEGHDTTRDSFYEIKIPLSAIGIDKAQLESAGIGIMMIGGNQSAVDSLPHDEATVNTPGLGSGDSSLEWADTDSFTAPFARIGN